MRKPTNIKAGLKEVLKSSSLKDSFYRLKPALGPDENYALAKEVTSNNIAAAGSLLLFSYNTAFKSFFLNLQ